MRYGICPACTSQETISHAARNHGIDCHRYHHHYCKKCRTNLLMRGTYGPPVQLKVTLIHRRALQRPVASHHPLHVVRVDVVREQPCDTASSSFDKRFDPRCTSKRLSEANMDKKWKGDLTDRIWLAEVELAVVLCENVSAYHAPTLANIQLGRPSTAFLHIQSTSRLDQKAGGGDRGASFLTY